MPPRALDRVRVSERCTWGTKPLWNWGYCAETMNRAWYTCSKFRCVRPRNKGTFQDERKTFLPLFRFPSNTYFPVPGIPIQRCSSIMMFGTQCTFQTHALRSFEIDTEIKELHMKIEILFRAYLSFQKGDFPRNQTQFPTVTCAIRFAEIDID